MYIGHTVEEKNDEVIMRVKQIMKELGIDTKDEKVLVIYCLMYVMAQKDYLEFERI